MCLAQRTRCCQPSGRLLRARKAWRKPRPRTFAAVVACLLSFFPATTVLASRAIVHADTQAQAYQLRNRWGEPVLSRHRVTQTLGLDVTGIGQPDDEDEVDQLPYYSPDDVHVSFHARMRLDADFGLDQREITLASHNGYYVPGLQRAPFDLMFGYFDISNVANGLMSARLGRQYVIDALGWWSFDGALVRLQLPLYFAVEGYSGWEQRGGFPLSTSRYEMNGTWRGDRLRMDPTLYPEFLEASMAPAQGVSFETIGVPYVHGRVAYRKVWNTGTVTTRLAPNQQSMLTYSGWRTSQERLAASADATVDEYGLMHGAVVYDLLRSMVTSWRASVDVFATSYLTVGVDVDREIPVFDGDSIWNWFATDPTFNVLTRGDLTITERLRTSLAAGVRWVDVKGERSNDFVADTSNVASPTGANINFDTVNTALTAAPMSQKIDVIARAAAQWQLDSGNVGLAALTDRGSRGHRDGVDVFGDIEFAQRYGLSARLSLYDWQDAFAGTSVTGSPLASTASGTTSSESSDPSVTSFSYVLGSAYRFFDHMLTRIEWEHDINRRVGHRYRVLASLQVKVMR